MGDLKKMKKRGSKVRILITLASPRLGEEIEGGKGRRLVGDIQKVDENLPRHLSLKKK